MKILNLAISSVCAACLQPVALADEQILDALLQEACYQPAERFSHNGLTLGMSQDEIVQFRDGTLRAGFPNRDSSALDLGDKTFIFWTAPDNASDPLYRIDFEKGADRLMKPVEGTVFTNAYTTKFGEPDRVTEDSWGFSRLYYGPVKDVRDEKFKSIRDCALSVPELRSQTQHLYRVTGRKFNELREKLATRCPGEIDAYNRYIEYALQPVVEVYVTRAKHRIEMKCPVARTISEIKNPPEDRRRGR
ncbi:MAG: hypothetical protein AAGL99_18195 [Pseudomonadota bacterium]